MVNRLFAVAPMLDWTTPDYRVFVRGLSRQALLYSEMVSTGAILSSAQPARYLAFSAIEKPLALQLGGSNRKELAQCARIAELWQYDEVNLNLGCPSPKVQQHCFGASLMKNVAQVVDCWQAMQQATNLTVSIKCRLGVDEFDSDQFLIDFIGRLADAGCQIFIIHARKAWLNGLSPKENREKPPLNYARVRLVKETFPQLTLIVNGGLVSLADCLSMLSWSDGVMVGRAAYTNPYLLAAVDQQIYQATSEVPSRLMAMHHYRGYVQQQLNKKRQLSHLMRPLLGLWHNQPNGANFRRLIAKKASHYAAGIEVFDQAFELMNHVSASVI